MGDDPRPLGGQFHDRFVNRRFARFDFFSAGLPVPPAAGDHPAAQVREPLPFRLGRPLQFGRLLAGRGQFTPLLLGEGRVIGALLPQRRPGFGDLVLQIEQLPPLILQPTGQLLFLPAERRLALGQPQLLLDERRLLGDDRGRLDAERFEVQFGQQWEKSGPLLRYRLCRTGRINERCS